MAKKSFSRTTIDLTETQSNYLSELAREEGINKRELILRAIDAYGSVYRKLRDAARRGEEIYVIDDKGNKTRYIF